MYNKILAPLDGSRLAECTLEHIKSLAKGCGISEVDLLYVVPPITPVATEDLTAPVLAQYEKGLEAWGKDYLAKLVEELKKEGISARGAVLYGNVAETILDYAKENGVDLIVMSSHGRSGLARWFLGNIADRIVRLSPVPVLVVTPRGAKKRAKAT